LHSRPPKPRAGVQTGHLSAALAHFANLTTRPGATLKFDPAKEQFIGNDGANRLLGGTYRESHRAEPNNAV
jgi:hypothetical protein